MKIAICGHGECGKDFAAEHLSATTSLRYVCGTSKYAAGIVFDKWGHKFWPTPEECWQARRDHRETWARIIGEYNAADPVALYRDCLAKQDLLTGVRWRHEMVAIKAARLVDLWVWIDADVPNDPTMTFGSRDCDVSIYNCKTPDFIRRLNILKSSVRFRVYGVGINDSHQPVATCPFYRVWKSMLCRCYDGSQLLRCPTYSGCLVASSWHLFSTFAAWMQTQNWKGCHLDKDILGDGKLYSEETCLFIPNWLNSCFVSGHNTGLPRGVRYRRERGKYEARFQHESAGLFSTLAEATEAVRSLRANYLTQRKAEIEAVRPGLFQLCVERINAQKL